MITDEMSPVSLRGLLDFNYAENPVPIDEVESVDEIVNACNFHLKHGTTSIVPTRSAAPFEHMVD